MKLSELHRAVYDEFGASYGGVLMRDHWLRELSATADQALVNGVRPRDVWLALCEDLQVPIERRHGRGMVELKE